MKEPKVECVIVKRNVILKGPRLNVVIMRNKRRIKKMK